MTIDTEQLVSQLDSILRRYRAAAGEAASRASDIPSAIVIGLLASSEAIIERLAPPGSPFIRRSNGILTQSMWSDEMKLNSLVGIVGIPGTQY